MEAIIIKIVIGMLLGSVIRAARRFVVTAGLIGLAGAFVWHRYMS